MCQHTGAGGNRAIPEAEYTATLKAVAAQPTVYAVSDKSTSLARIVRDGTQLQAPLVQVPGGWISRLVLTKEPYPISEHITFLGEMPAVTDYERTKPVGFMKDASGTRDDFVTDDSALALTTENGLFIVTGCSHSGICNIIEHARKVCNEERIAGVLGGFHLLEVSQQLVKTIEYFKRNNITNLYPCHCVSFAAKAEIHRQLPIHEVGVGMEIVL